MLLKLLMLFSAILVEEVTDYLHSYFHPHPEVWVLEQKKSSNASKWFARDLKILLIAYYIASVPKKITCTGGKQYHFSEIKGLCLMKSPEPFGFQKYCKFWSVSPSDFSKHNMLISDAMSLQMTRVWFFFIQTLCSSTYCTSTLPDI